MIHLVAAAIRGHGGGPINTVYIHCDSPFPEEEEFVKICCSRYQLNLTQANGSMKDVLSSFIGNTGAKAILVGTRRGDPHGAKLTHFDPTDGDWPRFMRVHPVIDWSYHEVWEFLRRLQVGWCKLYDIGYTSLGSTYNTIPNPALIDSSFACGYKPAWELKDIALERAGRYETI